MSNIANYADKLKVLVDDTIATGSQLGRSDDYVTMNGLVTNGALSLPTTEVTGSIPIDYIGNGTSKDVPTPMQIANDNGDGSTLAPDYIADQLYSTGQIVIDQTATGDARAYRALNATQEAISPVVSANWILETNQYGGRFWFKNRDNTNSNALFDSVRRADNRLNSDNTNTEANVIDQMTDINTFSVSVSTHVTVNTNLENYVLWVDQTTRKTAGYRTDAGVIQNSKNNTGTDLMKVDSVGNPIIEHYNPTTGFSIIMRAGNQTAGLVTPHSLQKKPFRWDLTL